MAQRFQGWLAGFHHRAEAAGVDAAPLGGDALAPLQEVLDKSSAQPEFTRTLAQYLALTVPDSRISEGQRARADHAALFSRLEAEFGVPGTIVAAIWGLETRFGAIRGDLAVLPALATLACFHKRGPFFEDELLAALRILAAGDATPEKMRGSWAGAMGHTQFMPSSYLAYAVDFDGDGRRDIWGDDPTDALASTAAYLAAHGWKRGQPWGCEVALPAGFDTAQAHRRIRRMGGDWAARGLRAQHGAIPDLPAALILPEGAGGLALLAFDNFAVIETYNRAEAYVIAVGHLADRIGGGAALSGLGPTDTPAPTRDDLRALQRGLTAFGFDTKGTDGLMGPNTAHAIRAFQRERGLPVDGVATCALCARVIGDQAAARC